MSKEQLKYLRNIKLKKIFIFIIQISILLTFIISWELLSKYNIIDSFIFSSPSKVLKTLVDLYNTNNLFPHIITTLSEIIISFTLSTILGFILALILYLFPTLKTILDPFITMINSLPKVALGPLIIIWMGANIKSIIFMSLLINLIVTTITIHNGMINVDNYKIKLFKIYKSSKYDLITKLIIPSSKNELISSLKINISYCLIGVIMGEFLSCKKGIGYLILYGTQVFNLSLVMCGILLLLLLSLIFILIINYIDKKTSSKN